MSNQFKRGVELFLNANVRPQISRVECGLRTICRIGNIRITPNVNSLITTSLAIIAQDEQSIRALESLCSRCYSADQLKREVSTFCHSRVRTCGGENQSMNKLRSVLLILVK